MKRLYAVLFILMVFNNLYAAPVSFSKAQKVASNSLKTRGIPVSNIDSDLKLVYTAQNMQKTSEPYFYVFNGNNSFVIVSGDDSAIPILGYSTEGTFDPSNIPVNMADWLKGYEKEIAYIRDSATSVADNDLQAEWKHLEEDEIELSRSYTVGSYLIQTKWNQGGITSAYCDYKRYNFYCPHSGTTYTYAGCGAVSMAQVIRYWMPKSPCVKGYGSNSYTHATYGALWANFGATTYNYGNMPNSIAGGSGCPNGSSNITYIREVAQLIYHCGVSINMDYGTGGSNSYTDDIESALIKNWGLISSKQVWRSGYNDNEWFNLIHREIDAERPIVYYGNGTGGHMWVCDGYNNSNQYHMNWGWGGSADGWYSLSALTPTSYGTTHNYTNNQLAIINIAPTLLEDPKITGTLTVCGSGTTTLYSNSYEESLNTWYKNGVNMNTSKYYIQVGAGTYKLVVGNSCTSKTVSVTVKNIKPAAPAASNVTCCYGEKITLTATAASGNTLRWYTTATGGGYSTSVNRTFNSTATYYVAQATSSGCVSDRTSVTVTVLPRPTTPTASNIATCSGSPAVLTASGEAGATFNWYETSSSTTILGTGATFTTPALTSGKSYYVEQITPQGCKSSRRSVVVSISNNTPQPTVTGNSACSGSPAVLTASGEAGATFNWYETSSSTTILGTGATFTTPALTSGKSYYVEQITPQGCKSSRKSVYVSTISVPAAPTASDVTITSGSTATLTATGSGTAFAWYDAATGGSLLCSTATYTTPVLTEDKIYYVEQSNASGCTSPRKAVNVIVTKGGSISEFCTDGTLLFKEDFGGNETTDPAVSPNGISQVSYPFSAGRYKLVKSGNDGGMYWVDMDDHTHPNDKTRGYMLRVDANNNTVSGHFYEQTISNLCSGTKLSFSMYVANLMKTQYSVAIYKEPNLSIEIFDGTSTTTFTTGAIHRTTNSENEWKQYGTTFVVPNGVSSVTFKIRSLEPATAGNDFVLDDIEVRLCAPQVTVNLTNISLCAGEPLSLSGSFVNDGTFTAPFAYLWLFSATNDSDIDNWTNVGNSQNLNIANVTTANAGYYRLAISSSESINSKNCRAMSDAMQLTIKPATAKPIIGYD